MNVLIADISWRRGSFVIYHNYSNVHQNSKKLLKIITLAIICHTTTWMGTLVVSAKHIEINTVSENVRSSSTYNFAFWHNTPGFCTFCYLWSQVRVMPYFFHVNGSRFHVHWHVEKCVQGDTKIYERDNWGSYIDGGEFKEQGIYQYAKFEFSFQAGQLLKIGARLNCQPHGDWWVVRKK